MATWSWRYWRVSFDEDDDHQSHNVLSWENSRSTTSGSDWLSSSPFSIVEMRGIASRSLVKAAAAAPPPRINAALAISVKHLTRISTSTAADEEEGAVSSFITARRFLISLAFSFKTSKKEIGVLMNRLNEALLSADYAGFLEDFLNSE